MRTIITGLGQSLQKRRLFVKSQPTTIYPANSVFKPTQFLFLWIAVAIVAQICIIAGYPAILTALRNMFGYPMLDFAFKYGFFIITLSIVVGSLLSSIERAFVDRQGTRAIIGFGAWLFLFVNLLIAMLTTSMTAG